MGRVGSGQIGSGQQFFKFRGSGGVLSRGFEILEGRVGSSQHTSKRSRVGSGQLTRPVPIRLDPTREGWPEPRKVLW